MNHFIFSKVPIFLINQEGIGLFYLFNNRFIIAHAPEERNRP